jgi:plastocyanin
MRLREALGLLAVVTFAGSCAGGSTAPDSGPSTSSSIDVGDNFFDPKATTVPVGTTVTWTWRGSNAHDVSFTGGPSSVTKTSGTYSRQFTTAGTYNYICSVHGAAMSGQVVVQ